ncbi:RelA/SpoT domain-containing protein [Hymenobacter terrigena]
MALKDRTPLFSKRQLDEAGQVLINKSTKFQPFEATIILNNHRSCHAYPINTFQATLRKKLGKLKFDAIISQRLKRTPSILDKLDRYPQMKLSRMQDIGGIRVVLAENEDVYKLVDKYKHPGFPHKLKNEKDYIKSPKESGYRCYHLVYEYSNPINPNYDGLMLELQIRTKLQHAWATAVETVGTFLDHSLKSSQGPQEWLDFFALVSHAFSYVEKTNGIEKFANDSQEQTFKEVRSEAKRLGVVNKLIAFSQVIKNVTTDKRQGSIHLVVLDIVDAQVTIKTYSKAAIDQASDDYMKEEATITPENRKQVVLVSSDSIELLKKAYPSYFLDTQEFLNQLRKIMNTKFFYRQAKFFEGDSQF